MMDNAKQATGKRAGGKEQLVVERIRAGIDQRQTDQIYSQACYAFGSGMSGKASTPMGVIPHYAPIRMDENKSGESMLILNSSRIAASRMMASIPVPEFPQVNKWTGEMRAQFWKRRATEGDWMDEIILGFTYGDTLGYGGVQVGIEDAGDYQRVTLQHIPSWRIIYDRTDPNPARSSWIAIVHHLPEDEAVEKYGEKARRFAWPLEENAPGHSARTVRVIEYFDKNPGLYACFIGDITEKPHRLVSNPFGKMIPFAWFVNTIPPGHGYPIGRVARERANVEALNRLQSRLLDQAERPDVHVVDADKFSPGDLKAFKERNPHVQVMTVDGGDMEKAWDYIARNPVDPAVLSAIEYAQRNLAQDSGLSDLDRGSQAGRKQTATEIIQRQNALAQNTSGLASSTAQYLRRVITKVMQIAAQHDTEPVEIDAFGTNFTINNPDDFRTSIEQVNEEASIVLISTDSLTGQDDEVKRALRLEALMSIKDGVGRLFKPEWWGREILKAINEPDIDNALITQSDLAQAAGTPPQAVPGITTDGGRPDTGSPEEESLGLLSGGRPD